MRVLLLLALHGLALGQTFDIREFGARCDGRTDDSGPVQAAIDAASPGGTVSIPCRAAIGASGLRVSNTQGVSIVGVGRGGFVALAPSRLGTMSFSPVMLLVNECVGCRVASLRFEGNFVPEAAIGFNLDSDSSITDNIVNNIAYPANAAIVSSGGVRNTYSGNQVNNTTASATDGTRGIWLGNNAQREWETNPIISGNTVSNTAATGLVVYAKGALVTGNTIELAGGAGIKVFLRGSPEVPTPELSNNTLTKNQYHGIQIARGAGILLQNNTFDSNGVSGIYGGEIEFSGRIVGNTFMGNHEAGVYLYSANNLTIEGNHFVLAPNSSQNHGIALDSNPGSIIRNVQISGNIIWDALWNGVTIWARGGSLSTVITRNQIGGSSAAGIYVEDTTGGTRGTISIDDNCFDSALRQTLVDTRSGGYPAQMPASCEKN